MRAAARTVTGQTLLRRRLARRTRALREQAELTLEQAAPHLDLTRSALHRAERGETKISVHLARSMMDLYDCRDDELLDLCREASKPGWWRGFGVRDPGYFGLETDAARALTVSPLRIPDLLQTEGYARRLLTVNHPGWSAKQIENHLAVRLIRQQRLTDPDAPLRLVALLVEAALHGPMDAPNVRDAQLRHLLAASEWPSVELRVLPDGVDVPTALSSGFAVLEFHDVEDPGVLYVDYFADVVVREEQQEVADAARLFEQVRSIALSEERSRTLIERLLPGPTVPSPAVNRLKDDPADFDGVAVDLAEPVAC